MWLSAIWLVVYNCAGYASGPTNGKAFLLKYYKTIIPPVGSSDINSIGLHLCRLLETSGPRLCIFLLGGLNSSRVFPQVI